MILPKPLLFVIPSNPYLLPQQIPQFIIIMNFLKKTLGKQQPRRDPPKLPSSFIKKHQTVQIWNNNIEDLIQKRAQKRQETSFDKTIAQIVQLKIKQPKTLTQEEYKNVIEQFVEAYRKHDKVSKVDKGNVKWVVCEDLVQKLKYKMGDTKVSKFIHELKIEMMVNEKEEKMKKIEEFETMVSFKSHKPVGEGRGVVTETKGWKCEKPRQKEKEKQKQQKKNSSLNRSQSISKKKTHNKSAKNLSSSSVKRLNTNLSRKKSEGDLQYTKLQHLLKDVSTKVVKGNIEYDYSSILEGSKSNIQCRRNNRNMTQKEEPKAIEKKVKKNEAFVFYRPGRI